MGQREWIPLGEAFDLIAASPTIEAKAKKWLEEYPLGWDTNAAGVQKWLREFSENWHIDDAINLVTEEVMSEVGRLCELRFSGLRGADEKERVAIPTTWFEERDSRGVSTPRGVDPDSDVLCLSPFHQLQDENFLKAVDFQVQGREPTPCWYDVLVQKKSLDVFLNMLGNVTPDVAVPPTSGRKRTPLWLAIDNAIAEKWPDGIPSFPSVKERNNAVCALLNRPISDDTFERYFKE